MLRISIADTPSRRTLIVEGTLIGAWIAELRITWMNASQELGGRKLIIDLSNVTVISREGEDEIFDLMKKERSFHAVVFSPGTYSHNFRSGNSRNHHRGEHAGGEAHHEPYAIRDQR